MEAQIVIASAVSWTNCFIPSALFYHIAIGINSNLILVTVITIELTCHRRRSLTSVDVILIGVCDGPSRRARGPGPNFDFRAGPNGLPTFCEKSKGMALCSRFVMIRLEGGENE